MTGAVPMPAVSPPVRAFAAPDDPFLNVAPFRDLAQAPRGNPYAALMAECGAEERAALSWLRSWVPAPSAAADSVAHDDELLRVSITAAEYLEALRARRAGGGPRPVIRDDGLGPAWVPGRMIGIVRARAVAAEKPPRPGSVIQGFWERDPAAPAMFCMPLVEGLWAWPHDIAVFALPGQSRPAEGPPGTVWLLKGAATAQNEAEIREGDGPLVLHATLFDWARAGGEGAVILDLAAWAPFLIQSGRKIVCSGAGRRGLDLATALDKALRRARPKIPPIGVVAA